MNAQTENSAFAREAGVALLELALVLPIVFLLFAATVESGRGLYARNQGELFAQELAAAIFHECKDKNLSDGDQFTSEEATRCVRRELESLHRLFALKNPRSGAIAAIYRQGPKGIELFADHQRSCFASPKQFANFSCADVQTRFTYARAAKELKTLAALAGWVVVVETFVKTDGAVERILAPLGLERVTYYSIGVL